MLKQGRIVALDTTQQPAQRHSPGTHCGCGWPTARCRERLRPMLAARQVQRRVRAARCTTTPRSRRVLAHLRESGRATWSTMELQQADLEDVFVQIMHRRLRCDMTGFSTLFYKEMLRFWKVSFQTIAGAGPDRAALPADLLACAGGHVQVYPGVQLYRVPDAGPGDDVAAAERLRQQLVEPDPVQDHRQHRVRPAAAAVALEILRRLRAGRRRARRGGRARRVAGHRGVRPCAGPAPAVGRSPLRCSGGGILGTLASSPGSGPTSSTSSPRSRTS